METLDSDELLRACRVLFGPEAEISFDFLDYIQASGIKSAFRRRAIETHPDTAGTTGTEGSAPRNPDEFIEARQAYEMLNTYVSSRSARPAIRPAATAASTGRAYPHRRPGPGPTRRPKSREAYFHQSKVPGRRLMFGEYLFYTGRVSWEALIQAIIWQRAQRPRFGQIALGWGIVGEWEVRRALKSRMLGEQLGRCLVRLGYINRIQLGALLLNQRSKQRPIGEYFVNNGIMEETELYELLSKFKGHNLKHN